MDWNVIVEFKGGDLDYVVVVDGYFDVIYGVGMFDNVFGLVMILDIV